ncbi:MAG: heme lyase CcmF/NrfE family subunit [Dehalococcoidia bacterium]|nr:MAG: heme lyase CcmF/NrfE family subunit [Dehalococcoidia bacterium]
MSLFGNGVLILAFLVAIYSIAAALLDSRKNKYGFPMNARYGVFAVAGLVSLAVALLLVSLLTHNFGLKYVADYSSRDTPLVYLITGLWAGNAGSLLFWGWIVSLSGAVLLWRSNKTDRELMPNALSIILFTEMLFLILLFIQSPFQALSPVPPDGAGLKPVLQNVGMIIHPPPLLAGYALFTVPFALVVAALFNRKVDDAWVLSAKRWAVAAWLLLGIGNVLGMWWAYAVLGWGGYWAWDPVENAGLMPWLLITAFLHSSMMYLRRGMFKIWAVILAMAAFWLTIFGAFLTRSDVKGSVHTFGDTPMTPAFIVFLAITLIGSVWLLIDRRRYIKSAEGDDALVSGTGTFMSVNLLLVISTIFILVGTTLPVFTNIIPPQTYFNVVNLPVFVLIILLAGLCILVGWKTPDLKKLLKQLLWPGVGALLVVIALIIAGLTQWYALVPLFILAAVFVATLIKWGRDVTARMRGKKEGFLPASGGLFMANRSRYGGYIIHISIVVLALGIIGSSVYKSQVEQILNVGDSVTLKGYTFTYNGFNAVPEQKSDGSVLLTVTANIDVSRGAQDLGSVHPNKILKFIYSGETIVDMDPAYGNNVAIRSNLAEDLYVIFEDFDGMTQQALLMVLVNPLVKWIWIGGFLLLAGGLVSFSATPRKVAASEDKG